MLTDVLLLPPFQLREKPLRSREAKDVAHPNKPSHVISERCPIHTIDASRRASIEASEATSVEKEVALEGETCTPYTLS
ncbi:hypothetical protein Aduo_013176 [Ancylostoma duodenale]